jgi:hypothetical protein
MRTSAIVASLFLSYSSLAQNSPDTDIIADKLKNIHISSPGNILLNNKRIDTQSYYFLSEPDTQKISARKPLIYLHEGLDTLAEYLSKDNPDKIFVVHNPLLISEQVATRIENIMMPKVIKKKVRDCLDGVIGNYPNPFNSTTNITLDLPYDSNVRITMVDLMGRETRLYNGYMRSGKQEFSIDINNEPSGIYFCRIDGEQGSKAYYGVTKMMKLK